MSKETDRITALEERIARLESRVAMLESTRISPGYLSNTPIAPTPPIQPLQPPKNPNVVWC